MDPEPPVDEQSGPAESTSAGRRRFSRRPKAEPKHTPANLRDDEQDVRSQFSSFYRDYLPSLVAHIEYLGATEQQACDVAQEALSAALVNWRNITYPRTWTRTTARRLYFKDKFRVEVPADRVGDELPAACSTSQGVEAEDHIVSLVRRLPPCNV